MQRQDHGSIQFTLGATILVVLAWWGGVIWSHTPQRECDEVQPVTLADEPPIRVREPAPARVKLPPPPPATLSPPVAEPPQAPVKHIKPEPPREVTPAPVVPKIPKQPEVQPRPIPAQQPVILENRAVMAVGEKRLNAAEQAAGKGGIELGWPDREAERQRLYSAFICLGMRDALLGPQSRLYTMQTAPARPWHLDPSRYSRFIRRSEVPISAAEAGAGARLKRHHKISGEIVRVFPRKLDSAFFGGLETLLDSAMQADDMIKGTYRLRGGVIIVEQISVNGRKVDGQIRIAKTCR